MSTRGSCSTVSQSQLVRGPSVRAHSTTVSHRAARYSAGGPERDVWRGAEGRIAVARVLEVSAGGRVPPSSSAVCFAGPRPGAASVERRCGRPRLPYNMSSSRRRFSNARTSCTARPGSRSRSLPGLCKTGPPAPLPRAPACSDARSEPLPFRRVIQSLHTHTEALIPFVCPQYVHTTLFRSSSRAQRVIAQLSQGRQSRI